ncbi:nitrogenase component 1 [Clostridium sp. WILCCON 0269]|uniref:Nitrogenase component 1 n=1 Tax=Candidatus Clostridium eludens TaxID=3381663 RepID=A0ABW8SJB6_9CLOT
MSKVTESPRGNCVLGGINAVLGVVDRVCPIFHSGPGCCMQTTAGEAGQAGGKTPYFLSGVSLPCSNMLEREVVFGGVDKLRNAIKGSIEVIDANAYFVLTGCTAGIIGDDIVSVINEFVNQGIDIYPIETPGFAGDSNLGYEVVFETFLDYVVQESRPKQKNLVNLLGIIPNHDPFWSGNFEELTRILRKLGLEVNTFFTEHQGIENIKNSSAAVLNIIVNPWLLKNAAKEYESRFGVPYLRFAGLPIGVTDTTDFIRQVAKALDLDKELVEKVIEEEEDYVYSYLETAIGGLSWKKFAVVGDANTSIGITRYLANDYSFTPVITIVTDPMFRETDKECITKRITKLEYARPPKVLFETDQYNITKALEENDEITLLIGSTNEREIALRKDIQCSVISFPITDRLIFNRTYAGYRGSLTLIEDLYDNL